MYCYTTVLLQYFFLSTLIQVKKCSQSEIVILHTVLMINIVYMIKTWTSRTVIRVLNTNKNLEILCFYMLLAFIRSCLLFTVIYLPTQLTLRHRYIILNFSHFILKIFRYLKNASFFLCPHDIDLIWRGCVFMSCCLYFNYLTIGFLLIFFLICLWSMSKCFFLECKIGFTSLQGQSCEPCIDNRFGKRCIMKCRCSIFQM